MMAQEAYLLVFAKGLVIDTILGSDIWHAIRQFITNTEQNGSLQLHATNYNPRISIRKNSFHFIFFAN